MNVYTNGIIYGLLQTKLFKLEVNLETGLFVKWIHKITCAVLICATVSLKLFALAYAMCKEVGCVPRILGPSLYRRLGS